MNKVYLLIISALTFFSACVNNKKADIPVQADEVNLVSTTSSYQVLLGANQPLPEAWKFDTLVFDKRIHIDNDTAKAGMKLDISFSYPISVPKNVDLEKIQQAFAKIFTSNKNFSGNTKQAFDTIVYKYVSDAIQYGKEWETQNSEFISFDHFEENFNADIYAIGNNLITTSSGGYSYSGGVHGSAFVTYNNIDLRDGSIIDENMLFNSGYEDKLALLIQNVVTQRNNSSDEEEHIMLLVEIPEIKSNNNFILSDEGIVYIYNQYEISAYVQGVVEIIIPYDKVKPLIKDKYIEIIEDIESN